MDNTIWHIEPTSKCILECPLCDRTWFYRKFKKRELHEINISQLVNFFKSQPKTIDMCGNNGDPIYHSDFIMLCKELKKIKCNLKITTNGSNKKKEWWNELGTVLDDKDTVIFSIDGLQDTNEIYRINSDWHSIMLGINILKKHNIRTIWKFIVFKHNEQQINEARKCAENLGMEFRLEFSDRWWTNDFMPSSQYVSDSYVHQKKELSNKILNGKMIPKCLLKNSSKMNLYIDSGGNFYPCCWTGLYSYRHNDIFDPRLKNFNIANKTMDQILQDPDVEDFFNKTKNYETASKCCKIYCGVSND